MFTLKIFTTISLAVISFGLAGNVAYKKNTAKVRITALYTTFILILAIAFMWQ